IAFLLNLDFNTAVLSLPLLSGVSMPVSTGDVLVMLGVLLLYFEILKSTRMSTREMIDHVLALILFLGMAFEFVTGPKAAPSSFLILLALSFVDVTGGFPITMRAAHHDTAFETPSHTA